MKTIKIKSVSELSKYISNMALIIATAEVRQRGSYKCIIDGIKHNFELQ